MEARELEPLCYRVRPMEGEGFDSWLDRLTTRHEVSRRELFRHLGADPHLADFDLARGARDVPERLQGGFRHLLSKLAWAVDVDLSAIEACVTDWPSRWLLPVSLRHFGCARCWQIDTAAGRPIAINRSWQLKLSWWCHDHGMPLSTYPDHAQHGALQQSKWLERAERNALRLAEYARPYGRLIAANRSALDFLLKKDDGLLPKGQRRYFEAMAENPFHLSSMRIALLALRHGRKAESARRFAAFVGMTRTELFGSSKGILRRQAPPVADIDIAPQRMTPALVTKCHWHAELSDLLLGYCWITERGRVPIWPSGIME